MKVNFVIFFYNIFFITYVIELEVIFYGDTLYLYLVGQP